MDCRSAHAMIGAGDDATPEQQQAWREHLAGCAACRDDSADPMARTLMYLSSEPAQPPDDFTPRLLARLPRESPLELQRQAVQRSRRTRRVFAAGLVGAAVVALLLGALAEPLLRGTPLGLFAKATRTLVFEALPPLVMLLAAAAVVAFLLRQAVQTPTAPRVFGGAALALALLFAGGGAVLLNDQGEIEERAPAGAVATLQRPVNIAGAHAGDVVTGWGNIDVAGKVAGDVASLLGNVRVEPGGTVGGDVLAGAGQVAAPAGAVAGSVFRGPQELELSNVLRGSGTATMSAPALRLLTMLLGALITLALAALILLLWPQQALGAGAVLRRRPWLALALGVMLTVLLALLALPALAFLLLTVFGVLLVPLLLLAVQLPYVGGIATVGQALGWRLSGTRNTTSALWGVAAQLVLIAALGLYSPLAGLLAFYLLGSLGVGALLLTRSRV